jgi:hypothetical protein
MAIARVFEAKGWTVDQYDAVIDRMELGGRAAPGVLFHWAAITDDGVRAVDVYDSREHADALAEEKIGPIVADLGLPMPDIAEYEVHSTLQP